MPRPLNISADALVRTLLDRSKAGGDMSLLDSCGSRHLGSHLLIAGIEPVDVIRLNGRDSIATLEQFQKALGRGLAAVFTLSYDFGKKLQKVLRKSETESVESDIYAAFFDSLIVHDYANGSTFATGAADNFREFGPTGEPWPDQAADRTDAPYKSNFSLSEYENAVENIKEYIRRGDTYQTNLTQKLQVPLSEGLTPQSVFWRLRRDHPAAFAAFLSRQDSFVVSASPERFFKITGDKVSASPIKGTRRRGTNDEEDQRLRTELTSSDKDRAENTMIVDLLRNDFGRVCEYGSVTVKELCKLEQHPTLFHLVSTVEGKLRDGVGIAEVLSALFPCGSITGAPKIRTMEIIEGLESSNRGLPMGAIGCFIPDSGFEGCEPGFDLSVAIRTMVIRDGVATFNVGGGVTIESDPTAEYEESMLKAKALLAALGNK